MAERTGLMGVFRYLDDLLAALQMFAQHDRQVHAVYSPVARHEIHRALGLKPSSVRYFTLTGAVLGLCTGVGLLVYTCLQWQFVVGGKPVVPFVPAVVVGFEFCILLGVIFNLVGMLTRARLPQLRLASHYDDRFNQDRFGVVVLCSDQDREDVSKVLREAGAEEIHEVRE